MAGLFDSSGDYVDLATGRFVPGGLTPQPGQANASWNPLRALGHTIAPALIGANPSSAYEPAAPPPTPPDASAQLAAVGIPPTPPAAAPEAPPQAPEAAPATTPAQPPPQAPTPAPMPAPVAAPSTPTPAPQPPSDTSDNPWAGVSNNARNNPLNLRFAGQDGASNVNGFAAFPTMDAGLQAARKQFSLYAGRGIDTLTGLVSSWAPKNENDTAAYIQTVSHATGLDPNAKIDLTDPTIQAKLIPAMSLVENGPTGSGGPSPSVGRQMPEVTTLSDQTSPGLPGYGPNSDLLSPRSITLPYPNAVQSGRSNQLLALAAGLMGGRSFGDGMSRGLTNMLAVRGDEQKAQMAANSQAIQLGQLGVSEAYKNAMMVNAFNRTGLMANKPAGPPTVVTDTQGNQHAVVRLGDGSTAPLPGVTPAMLNAGTNQERLQLAQRSLAAKLDPDTVGALSQARTAGNDTAKEITSLMGSQAQDVQGLSDINNAQNLITQRPDLMGPTLANRWARFAAENGLSGNAADLNALQKMTADQRNTALAALTGGHVGGIRSNAELQNLSKAVADVTTSPAAAQFILNMQKNQLQARQAWRQELQNRYQNDPGSITGQNYNFTKQKFLDDYFKANPMPEYVSPSGGGAAPPASPPAQPGTGAAPVKGVSNGVQWSFTPSSN